MKHVDNDLSRFKDVFFEEAAEHIAAVEEALLRLEAVPADAEPVAAVFRAVHSIKGSGGMFGFDGVVRFAHALESLLDQLRSGAAPVGPGLAGLLLRSSDILKSLVEQARHGGAAPPETEAVLGELEGARTAGSRPAVPHAPAAEASPACPRLWRLRFEPAPDIFRTGMDPLLVLRDLESIGEVLERRLDAARLPALAELDPDVCSLAWDVTLRTAGARQQILDLFAFVEDGARIELVAQESGPPSPAVPAVPAPSETPRTEGAPPLARSGHILETSTVRVAVAKVDKLVDLVGELVIAQSVAGQILRNFSSERIHELAEAFGSLERNTREMQERVMAIRMQPIGGVFSRFPRLVRDLAASSGKQIALETAGEETELDKSVIERLADPLTHLVRNSADHGIEPAAERRAAGKPEQGVVRLLAYHESGNVVVEVSDDGRGLDSARIRAKALERGLIADSEALDEEDLHSLIFRPGFSTAETVTDISGRGVGMDVVRRNVEAVNGSIAVRSRPGLGASFRIRLPLTLAILDGLLLKVGAETYVLPLVSIVESIRPRSSDLLVVAGRSEMVAVRGEPLALVRLHRLFGVPGAIEDAACGAVVITEHEGRRVAVLVDELLGQQQVVVKSLETHFHRVDGVMGATILGNGRAALILDAAGIAAVANRSGNE